MSRRRKPSRLKLPKLPPSKMEQDLGTPLYRAWKRVNRMVVASDRLRSVCRNEAERQCVYKAVLALADLSQKWVSDTDLIKRAQQATQEAAS